MKDNIKAALITGISVGLAIYTGELLKVKSLFYASIAAAVVSQTSYKEVFKLGIKRVLGTIFGAFMGLVFYWFLPHNLIFFAMGVLIIVFTCSMYINIPVNMACIVFLAVSTNLKGAPAESYALYRVADTTVGILSALVVSYIFKSIEGKVKKIKI